jgi:RNA polymerase sigma factor (sigma-70 family)
MTALAPEVASIIARLEPVFDIQTRRYANRLGMSNEDFTQEVRVRVFLALIRRGDDRPQIPNIEAWANVIGYRVFCDLLKQQYRSAGNPALDLDLFPADPRDIDAELDRAEIRLGVHRALVRLTPRRREALQLRFGLTDGRWRMHKEVAAEMGGISTTRVRMLITEGLKVLKTMKV